MRDNLGKTVVYKITAYKNDNTIINEQVKNNDSTQLYVTTPNSDISYIEFKIRIHKDVADFRFFDLTPDEIVWNQRYPLDSTNSLTIRKDYTDIKVKVKYEIGLEEDSLNTFEIEKTIETGSNNWYDVLYSILTKEALKSKSIQNKTVYNFLNEQNGILDIDIEIEDGYNNVIIKNNNGDNIIGNLNSYSFDMEYMDIIYNKVKLLDNKGNMAIIQKEGYSFYILDLFTSHITNGDRYVQTNSKNNFFANQSIFLKKYIYPNVEKKEDFFILSGTVQDFVHTDRVYRFITDGNNKFQIYDKSITDVEQIFLKAIYCNLICTQGITSNGNYYLDIMNLEKTSVKPTPTKLSTKEINITSYLLHNKSVVENILYNDVVDLGECQLLSDLYINPNFNQFDIFVKQLKSNSTFNLVCNSYIDISTDKLPQSISKIDKFSIIKLNKVILKRYTNSGERENTTTRLNGNIITPNNNGNQVNMQDFSEIELVKNFNELEENEKIEITNTDNNVVSLGKINTEKTTSELTTMINSENTIFKNDKISLTNQNNNKMFFSVLNGIHLGDKIIGKDQLKLGINKIAVGNILAEVNVSSIGSLLYTLNFREITDKEVQLILGFLKTKIPNSSILKLDNLLDLWLTLQKL